jgi:hypothetical protein
MCNFPLGGEVVEKQGGIEELGEIFDADRILPVMSP